MNYRSSTTPKPTTKVDTKSSGFQPQNQQYKFGMQNSKLVDTQKQKLIQDQNYSNNILMTALSTLESLEGAAKKSTPKRQMKAYGYYDKVNYDNKNYDELKSQLQTQLTLLKASRQIFEEENPKAKYELPNSFNEQKVKSEINRFKQVFQGDDSVYGMCQDFEKINNGDFRSKMNFENKKLDVKYPENESNKYKKDVVQRGIFATNQMVLQKEKIQKMLVKDQKDLPIYVKPSGYQQQYQSRLRSTRPW